MTDTDLFTTVLFLSSTGTVSSFVVQSLIINNFNYCIRLLINTTLKKEISSHECALFILFFLTVIVFFFKYYILVLAIIKFISKSLYDSRILSVFLKTD